MSASCSQCGRETGPTVVLRCQSNACPLRSLPERASAQQFVIMLGGIGLLIAAMTAGFAWAVGGNRHGSADGTSETMTESIAHARAHTPTPPPAAQDIAIPDVAPRKRSWSDILMGRPAPEPIAAAPAPTGPDWGAAERVASFVCSGSLSASRRAICTSWPLATSDYNLGITYRTALTEAPDPRKLRRDQTEWLKQLDAAEGDETRIAALYQARDAEIAAY